MIQFHLVNIVLTAQVGLKLLLFLRQTKGNAHEKYDKLHYNQIAEQIIKNAKAGHADSVAFILAIASENANTNEDADTSNPDKEKDEQKPKTDKPIKTGNPDLDEVFKDAYPTESKNGEKSYHLPDKTQAELVEEVSKIEGAVKNPPSKDGKSQIIRLPDGKWINTYPNRTSTGGSGWEIHMNPNPKSTPKYKGDTKK